MMEKYGTYRVFKNTDTGVIRKILIDQISTEELEKLASNEKWEEMYSDPELEE
jgi:hypothetical protein